ncbi:MAG: phosphonate metabolism protein/1,5-bisphosphokinase (PRPP-forming) PhnN [Rhodospirillales bacterium CG15_BIG_FIL_POST_REV_8_21_14_020_66_15]|nr:MAG: phosphonate metabolism protein/1,5-bisphosphokinase (PRPP-forming) PhnN [Rhodospirillales bacterium CG15_BIG_FIL_POST_REV_8_21_14_020_66_15]
MKIDDILTGTMVLVVGPSGAGKDSLIEGARDAFSGDADLVFPRRQITRPAEAAGEDHVAVTESQFHARRELGGYLLSWGAHGLWYGIPAEVAADLRRGRTVVVNASRSVIDEARSRLGSLRIVLVNADDDTLRARMGMRGRETDLQVARRLERARTFRVEGPDVIEFPNDGLLEAAVVRFTDLLRGLA